MERRVERRSRSEEGLDAMLRGSRDVDGHARARVCVCLCDLTCSRGPFVNSRMEFCRQSYIFTEPPNVTALPALWWQEMTVAKLWMATKRWKCHQLGLVWGWKEVSESAK